MTRLSIDPCTDSKLQLLNYQIRGCSRCTLAQGRIQAVPGSGDPTARLMVVGEAPGYEEDRQGLPFVGRSGDLLNKGLLAAGLKRENIYITNVLKCRPPENRDPLPAEVQACKKYLYQQISLISPQLILALGRVSSGYLLEREIKITKERGRLEFLPGNPNIMVSIIYHPSYVLRNRNTQIERDFFHDILQARSIVYGKSAITELLEGSAG